MELILVPKWLLSIGLALILAVQQHSSNCSAMATKIPAIIVFGDSTVDAGNNNQILTLLKSNFHPYGRDFSGGRPTGRFSNGRIPPDFISEAFGLRPIVPAYLDPTYNITDFAIGVCFASAGTGYDSATSDVLNVMPLWKEIEYYKEYQNKLKAYVGHRRARTILKQAVYLVSLGTNDFLENYYIFPRRRLKYTIDEYQDFLIEISTNFLKELYSLGARKISLTGLPPMGCLPLERTLNIFGNNECDDKLNKVALKFNAMLKSMTTKLNDELPGLILVFTESVYGLLYSMINNPASYGFEVAGMACCSTGTFEMSYLCSEKSPLTCTDANKYIFWDAFHPTEKTNHIITSHLIPLLKTKFLR
ncbi:GDSL esterase/lipase At2g42990 isoform X2 [Cannabis sativa]|uniref:GDSL esterase/lipase n=1 Tax=Cannabis sativa TaxID=3483 RepID=A0A803QR26_CANSA|nr:GDSL esterase/lipase At2g42990 isoform X2 [Cannabis sativa]